MENGVISCFIKIACCSVGGPYVSFAYSYIDTDNVWRAVVVSIGSDLSML